MSTPINFLCISCEFKGIDFIREIKAAGHNIYLVTESSNEKKPWPRDILDDIFFVQEIKHGLWKMDDLTAGLAFFMRANRIDRIIALDDFDVEKAALLREHFRMPGMGQTTARYFRDKLAMRIKAQDSGIKVPAFSSIFNDEVVNHFAATVPAPWVIKPRSEASAAGITKVHSAHELWEVIHQLGDQRDHFLVEQFKPGDVYHADSLSVDGKVVFCRISQYLNTPFEVAHGGGIFRSHTVEYNSKDDKDLQKLTAKVMNDFGMQYSASHTEFIRSKEDGTYYFLETSARVGGAHLAEMVEYSSGINLWKEWAKIEIAKAGGATYELPKVRKDHAGIVVSLSRFEHPDTSAFQEPELVWRLDKAHHIGLIVQSPKRERILEILDDYANRIHRDFHATV